MKRIAPLLLAALVLWTGTVAHAAYNIDPVVMSLDASLNQPGTFILRMKFSGNAGEPDQFPEYTITGSTTQAMVQDWLFRKQAELNTARTISRLAALQPGRSIPPAQATVTLTACDTFKVTGRRLIALKQLVDAGLTDATALSEINTLKTSLNTNYPVGCVGTF